MSCQHNSSIQCNCTYSCSRHAKCCDCIEYHRRNKEFPACFFSTKMEATFDRTLSALIRDRK